MWTRPEWSVYSQLFFEMSNLKLSSDNSVETRKMKSFKFWFNDSKLGLHSVIYIARGAKIDIIGLRGLLRLHKHWNTIILKFMISK